MNNKTQKEPDHISQPDTQVGQEKTSKERFQVSFISSYGYILQRENNSDVLIFPEFLNENIKHDFYTYMHLPEKNTMRLMCDCTGEYFQKNGRNSYRVKEAHLFFLPYENVTTPELNKNR